MKSEEYYYKTADMECNDELEKNKNGQKFINKLIVQLFLKIHAEMC